VIFWSSRPLVGRIQGYPPFPLARGKIDLLASLRGSLQLLRREGILGWMSTSYKMSTSYNMGILLLMGDKE
jgi:hypothetical protein